MIDLHSKQHQFGKIEQKKFFNKNFVLYFMNEYKNTEF